MSWWTAGLSGRAARNWRWSWKRRATRESRSRRSRRREPSGAGACLWHAQVRLAGPTSNRSQPIMVAVKEGKEAYLSRFASFEEKLAEGDRSPLKRLRRDALDRFASLGFPSLKDEEWRFTNL